MHSIRYILYGYLMCSSCNIFYGRPMKRIIENMAKRREEIEQKVKDIKLTVIMERYINDKLVDSADVTTYRKGEKVRIESRERRGKVTAIIDGTEGCIKWPDETIRFPSEPHSLMQIWRATESTQLCRPHKPDPPCLIVPREPVSIWDIDILSKHKSKVIGEENIKDRECWVVSTEEGGPSFSKLWIDKKLFAAIKWKTPEKYKITVVWDEFKGVPNLDVLPHKMEGVYSFQGDGC